MRTEQAGAASAQVRAARVPTLVAQPSPGGQDRWASPAAPGSGSAPFLAPPFLAPPFLALPCPAPPFLALPFLA
ncbi:MAG: hypothetical protein LBU50_04650, partial [Cellulomonas sp.]|nr:hypothetical protein [Cellulomonas sp.]